MSICHLVPNMKWFAYGLEKLWLLTFFFDYQQPGIMENTSTYLHKTPVKKSAYGMGTKFSGIAEN